MGIIVDNELHQVKNSEEASIYTLADRLRAERVRLGLSQEQLAERAGVHRRTQTNYELGKTEPSGAYLTRVQRLGVDTFFVSTGVRTDEREQLAWAQQALLRDLLRALGHEADGVVPPAIKEAFEHWMRPGLASLRDQYAERLVADSPRVKAMVAEAAQIDRGVLSTVVQAVREEFASRGLNPTPAKQATAIALLYESAKAAGSLPPAVLRDVIALLSK